MVKKLKALPNVLTEDQEQTKFVVWVKKQGFRIVASANGGSRNLLEAMKLKRMGVAPGFPDLFIPVVSGVFYGLFIEMKRSSGGKISELQQDWIDFLNNSGYCARVAYGFEDAKQIFQDYISLMPRAA